MTRPSERGTRAGLWLLACVVLAAIAALLLALFGNREDDLYEYAPETITNSVLGASFAMLILRRDGGNRIGWLFFFSGMFSSVQLVTGQYATYGLAAGLAAAAPAGWASAVAQVISVGLILLLLAWFPTGRAARGLAAVPWVIGAAIVCSASIEILRGGPVGNFPAVSGPFDLLSGPVLEVLGAVTGVLFVVGILGALASLLARLLRASAVERAQVKLLLLASVAAIGLIVVSGIAAPAGLEEELGTVAWTIAGAAPPTAIGIAILRYRLYDIDVIINRAVVYAVLTAVLVGAYAGGVLLFRTILDPVTGDNDVAIAASTLAVAALFGPARRRIQSFIDRRFYRSRYDAQKTLEAFSVRLRDEVDLDAVAKELSGVVGETFRPSFAGIWLVDRNDSRTLDG